MQSTTKQNLEYVFQTIMVAHNGHKNVSSPCPPVPPHSLTGTDALTLRPGEVDKYSVYLCVWQQENLVCAEPLKYTSTTLTPDNIGGVPNAFTSTNFVAPALEGNRLKGWLSQTENPFELGVWRPGINEYDLTTTGYACMNITSDEREHHTKIQVESPKIAFNAGHSKCPSIAYSQEDNTIGITGKNPIYSDKLGCSIVYDIEQPSYATKYGFLQVMAPGASISMQGVDSGKQGFTFNILDLRSQAIDLLKDVEGLPQTIFNKTKIEPGQKKEIVATTTTSLFTAPYFHQDCEADNATDFTLLNRYQNDGTQFYNHLMMKVDPQPGKKSYWIPVQKAGWFAIYTAECSTPPCGLGLGAEEGLPYGKYWEAKDLQGNHPHVNSIDIPNWSTILQDSYNTFSETSFHEMDFWLSCPDF